MPDEIHVHVTAQPGQTVHIHISPAEGADEPQAGSEAPDDDVRSALARLGRNTGADVAKVAGALTEMGYVLRLPKTAPGKAPENYLRILDPRETRYGSGVGYMQPTTLAFTRGSVREKLLAMPGARRLTQAVAFDHANDTQNALNAAKAVKL